MIATFDCTQLSITFKDFSFPFPHAIWLVRLRDHCCVRPNENIVTPMQIAPKTQNRSQNDINNNQPFNDASQAKKSRPRVYFNNLYERHHITKLTMEIAAYDGFKNIIS